MAVGKKGSSGSSSSSGGNTRTSRGNSSSVPKTWFRVLWFLILLSMLTIAIVNIKPYVDAASALGVTIVDAAFIKFISWIPVVNWLASTLGVGVTWIIGTALWGTFQLIEVLPVILYNHPGFLQEVIQDSESHSQYAVKDNDEPTVAGLKRVYNKLPIAFLENLGKVRLVAYTIDFCICFWKYSPVASGKITDFFYYVMTGQFNKIDGGNLALALITLFGVEIGLNLLLWVGKLAFTAKRATQHN